MSVREIFEELIKEAMKGNIVIGDKTYNVGFNTLLEDDGFIGNSDNPTLSIADRTLFLDYLAQYVDEELALRQGLEATEEKDAIKEMMTELIINMTPVEWNNPADAIRRRIEFLQDEHLSDRREINVDVFDSNLVIEKKRNGLSAETPFKMIFTLGKDGSEYHLPSIYFGIENGSCYIYDIRSEENRDDDYTTRIRRTINGMYDEEMEDVSPSSVLVAELFLKELSRNGINSVKLVPFSAKGRNPDSFIRTFIRSMQDLDGIEIRNYPYELDEYLSLELGEVKSKNDGKEM